MIITKVQIITYACPETACESDCSAVTPALDQLEKDQLLPDEMLGDTLYGSDANVVESKKRGVNLINPVSGKSPKEPPEDPSPKQERLAIRREEEKTEEWRAAYARRAGLEGTNSGVKRKTGLGRLRVRGQKNVFNAIFLKTVGWNILRASKSKKMKAKIAKIVKKSSTNGNSSVNLRAFCCLTSVQRPLVIRFCATVPFETTIPENRLAA